MAVPQSSISLPVWDTPYTQEEGHAMFASVVWFHDQQAAGRFDEYEGMNIAILGEQILDADPDEGELIRRLKSLEDTIPLRRIVLKYIPRPGEWDQLH